MMSLLLTLLATPVFYTLFDDVIQWRQRRTLKRERKYAVETTPAPADPYVLPEPCRPTPN